MNVDFKLSLKFITQALLYFFLWLICELHSPFFWMRNKLKLLAAHQLLAIVSCYVFCCDNNGLGFTMLRVNEINTREGNPHLLKTVKSRKGTNWSKGIAAHGIEPSYIKFESRHLLALLCLYFMNTSCTSWFNFLAGVALNSVCVINRFFPAVLFQQWTACGV